jgi:hypothetical protein
MTMTIKLYRHEAKPEVPAECHDRLVKVLELERMKPPNPQGTKGSSGTTEES